MQTHKNIHTHTHIHTHTSSPSQATEQVVNDASMRLDNGVPSTVMKPQLATASAAVLLALGLPLGVWGAIAAGSASAQVGVHGA
jgi:hypothetical protein